MKNSARTSGSRATCSTLRTGPGAFGKLSAIKDGDPQNDAQAMLKELAADHATLVATAKAAREGADEVTASLIDDRIEAHEKHAWMLRASLG